MTSPASRYGAREFASIARNRSKPVLRARNRFARIAQARRKALGLYLSITRNCLARYRVLVLAGVVAIARALVDRIAQVAHIDRLRDSTSAGKKARPGKKRNRTRCRLHFNCRNCRARQGKLLPVRRMRVGAKNLPQGLL